MKVRQSQYFCYQTTLNTEEITTKAALPDVLNGALNRVADFAAARLSAGESRHVQRNTVSLATYPGRKHRPALLAWAQDVAATHRTFLHVVLRASVILPESHHQLSPNQHCHLPRLPRVVLELLGELLGVPRRWGGARGTLVEALAAIAPEAAGP